ncbi:MAG: hypothetical protein HY298_16420 [Verrucomicrobia bacterium]|nr:hypothetical protein [Verrucomicrobiota bacterium]
MRHLQVKQFGLGLGLGCFLLLGVGCKQDVTPPVPIPVDQLPSAFEKAFGKAKPEIKSMSAEIISSLQSQDYAKAYSELQNLSAQSGLNKEQQNIAQRGMLSVHELLQTAEAKGDEKAATTLENYRSTK